MILTADKIERRLLIFGATVVWLIGMLLIGTLANGAVVTVGSFLATVALGSYLQVAYTFTAENFPTHLRTRGFALADGGGHLGGLWAPSCYPPWCPAPPSSSGAPPSESPGCWPA